MCVPYLASHRDGNEAERLLVETLARVPASAPPSLPLARVFHAAGNTAFARGEHARAEAMQGRAIAMFRALGERREVCDALVNEQRAAMFANPSRGAALAAELTRETSALLAELPDDPLARRGRAHSLCIEGWVADVLGDPARGVEPYARGLAMFRALGDLERVCVVCSWFGETLRSAGLLTRALACYEESLVLARRFAIRPNIQAALTNIAFTGVALGQPERARLALREALPYLRGSLGDVPLASALLTASATAAHLGAVEDAARILGASRGLAARQSLSAPDRVVDVDVETRLRLTLGDAIALLLAEGSALPREDALALAERAMAASPLEEPTA